MFKVMIVYLHVLATCLAIGSIMTADWRLLRGRHFPLRPGSIARLQQTQRGVNLSLIALWISGALLVWIGYMDQPERYLNNEKLWAKISVVTLLTINGWLLHRFAFPALLQGRIPANLPSRKRHFLTMLSSISGASWLFAVFLGIARPWNHTIGYFDVMSVFFGLFALTLLTAIFLSERTLFSRGSALDNTSGTANDTST
jgi:hypothetical protein